MANFTQEGSAYLLTTLAKGGTIAADVLYIGLANAAPTATSTLATVAAAEAAVGAARKNVTSASATISAAGVLSATAVQWGTGVTVTGATHWFLCNVVSGTTGKLIAWNALSATRTLTTADTMTETITDIHIA